MSSRSLRICMLVGTDMSHDARVWKEARTLATAGYSVTVLAAYNPQLPEHESVDGVDVIRVVPRPFSLRQAEVHSATSSESQKETSCPNGREKLPRAAKPLFAGVRSRIWGWRVCLETLRLIRRFRPDVIHIHDADRLLIGGSARCLNKAYLIYDAHEYVTGLLIDSSFWCRLRRLWHTTLESRLARRANSVITVSTEISDLLADRYNIARPHVLHNYPLLTDIEPSQNGNARHEGTSGAVLLYQGRLVPNRGVEQFLRTLTYLPKEVTGVVIGGGPMETSLRRLTKELQLLERVNFVPQVPWNLLLQQTATADIGIYLQPATCDSYKLALPNKVFEYLMAGIPVVASNFPVIRSIVEGENVGITVPPDDPTAIAAAVKDLLDQPERLEQMKENAKRVSRDKYNWETQEQTLLDLYAEIAANIQERELVRASR